jgi:hypothetical protein
MKIVISKVLFNLSSAASFTWEDMTNYIGRREQFIGNCGHQNDAKDVTEGANIFKLFFYSGSSGVYEIFCRKFHYNPKIFKKVILI